LNGLLVKYGTEHQDMNTKSIATFLAKLTFFLLFVLVLDQSVGFFLSKMYFNVPRKLTYAINKSNEEILIYGSSRANRHYNPAVFEEKLGLSCFNNGMDGRNIYYHYALFSSTIERYTPKIVILDLIDADYSITNSDWSTDRLNVLLPFYGHNEYIDEIIKLRSGWEGIKMLSSIYPYNSAIIEILKTFLTNKDANLGYHGYLPAKEVEGVSYKIERVNFENKLIPDPLKISYLKKIITTCENRKIKLMVIISPWYSTQKICSEILEEILSDGQQLLWDFSHHENFSDKSLFSDASHLNEYGSKLFSEFIADTLKSQKNNQISIVPQ
jgi:hypothetical protein